MSIGVVLVGCGYVSAYYANCIRQHERLKLVSVYDTIAERAQALAKFADSRAATSLDEAISDSEASVVVNLTPIEEHIAVSTAALAARKHVYSEKPVSVSLDDARQLDDLARSQHVRFSGAPCCILGPAGQTLLHAIRAGKIGRVRCAYVEMDDGPHYRMPHQLWRSQTGVPWPYETEAQDGCVMVHAGYALSWILALFGSVRQVTAMSSTIVSDDDAPYPVRTGPDFGVSVLGFDDRVQVRLTCSVIARRRRAITVCGDDGYIEVDDCSDERSAVRIYRYRRIRRRLVVWPFGRRLKLPDAPGTRVPYRGAQKRDFARGILEMLDSIELDEPSRLSGDFLLHSTELIELLNTAGRTAPAQCKPKTTCEPMRLMNWADTRVGAH